MLQKYLQQMNGREPREQLFVNTSNTFYFLHAMTLD